MKSIQQGSSQWERGDDSYYHTIPYHILVGCSVGGGCMLSPLPSTMPFHLVIKSLTWSHDLGTWGACTTDLEHSLDARALGRAMPCQSLCTCVSVTTDLSSGLDG